MISDITFDCGILQSGSSLNPEWYQPDPLTYAKKLVLKLDPKFNFSISNMGEAAQAVIRKPTGEQLLELSEQVSLIPCQETPKNCDI